MNIWTLCLYENPNNIKAIFNPKTWKDWIKQTTDTSENQVPSFFINHKSGKRYETIDIESIDTKDNTVLPLCRFTKKKFKGITLYESHPFVIPENTTFIPIRIDTFLVFTMFAVYKSVANSSLDSLVEKSNKLFNFLKQHNSIRINIKGDKGFLNHYSVSIHSTKTKSNIFETPIPEFDVFETGKVISKRAFLYSDISWIGKGKIKGKDSIRITIEVNTDKDEDNPFIARFNTNIYDMAVSEEKYIFGCYSTLFINTSYTMEK